MSQVPCLHEHLANAARVKYPAACCESRLIPRQLAAGYLIETVRSLCGYFSELDIRRFSDGDWYEFTKSGITKEKAILAVCEACRAGVSEVVAFGDDYAGIGMLKMCGIGVATGNAIQEVKGIAGDCSGHDYWHSIRILNEWNEQ